MNPCFTTKVLTPYYRTIIDPPKEYYAVEEPDFNYGPYQTFALKSKLYPWIKENIGKNLGISLVGRKLGPKIQMEVIITNLGQVITLTSDQMTRLQQKVNSIIYYQDLVNHVLIYSPSNVVYNGNIINSSWIAQILPFIKLEDKYNLAWSTIDIKDGALYVDLIEFPDYFAETSSLLYLIQKKITKLFEEGYLVNPSDEIIKNWELVSKTDELWHLSFPLNNLVKDSGGSTAFLLDRVTAIENIPINLGVDKQGLAVIKHYIGLLLQDIFFNQEIIYLPADDLKSCLKRLRLVNQGKTTAYRQGGKVATIGISLEDRLPLIQSSALELGLTEQSSYMENYQLIFSVKIPFETNEISIEKELFGLYSKKLQEIKK